MKINRTIEEIIAFIRQATTLNKIKKDDVADGLELLEFNKVDKVIGKGLSTNDFTWDYRDKVDTITSNYVTEHVHTSNDLEMQLSDGIIELQLREEYTVITQGLITHVIIPLSIRLSQPLGFFSIRALPIENNNVLLGSMTAYIKHWSPLSTESITIELILIEQQWDALFSYYFRVHHDGEINEMNPIQFDANIHLHFHRLSMP